MAKKFSISKRGGCYSISPILQFLNECKDGVYNITLSKERRRGSDKQRGYLWGCVYPMVKEGMLAQGWEDITDEQKAHEFCKGKFANRDIVNRHSGEVRTLPLSTSQMDTEQLTTYIEAIRTFAAEYLYMDIPDPNRWWRYVDEPITLSL